MRLLPALLNGHRYEKMQADEDGDIKGRITDSYALISTVVVVLVAFGFGFGFGCTVRMHQERDPLYGAINIKPVKLAFVYNETFTERQNSRTNDAWDQIFPDGAGFVHHKTLSPNTSGIAAFHQLHCLNQLRVAFYQTDENLKTVDKDPQFQNGLAHVRHCFDYLRQSIMCAADSNLEPVDFKLGGATGWGSVRNCRNLIGRMGC